MVPLENRDGMETILVRPGWGRREAIGPGAQISSKLRRRFREWNKTWQHVLDPVLEISWPNPEVGRRGIAEGKSLVIALQDEVGPAFRVVGDFDAYDPDAYDPDA